MANQTLSALQSQLQNQAKVANKLVFNASIISDSYPYQAVYALIGHDFVVSFAEPTKQIALCGNTLTISGNCALYGLGGSVITITMTGVDVPSANCILDTTFASFPLTTLQSQNLIPSSSVSTDALLLFSFSNVSLNVKAPAKGVAGIYTLSVGSTTGADPITLVDVLGLSLSDPGLTFTRTATLNGLIEPGLVISGNVNVGPMTLLTSLVVPVGSGQQANIWEVSFKSGAGDQAVSLENLIQLLAGSNPFTLLPSSLSGIGNFALLMMSVKFDFTDPTSPIVSNIFVNIGTQGDKPWPVVSSPVAFTIEKIGFSITLDNPFNSVTRNTSVFLYGDFFVGTRKEQVTLDVGMSIDITTGDWVASLSGELKSNGLAELFGSLPLTSGSAAPDMPVGMDMTTITLAYFTVAYNASSSSDSLSLIGFNISSNNLVFPIIPNVLAAANPYAAFNITNPTSSENYSLTGTAGAELLIGDIIFNVSATKPAAESGWTFEASLDPGSTINLDDLVTTFMSKLHVTLPSWISSALPTITALDLQMVTPTAKSTDANSYSISGEAKWDTLDFGLISLEDLDALVTVNYDGTNLSGAILASALIDDLITVKVGYSFQKGNNDILLQLDGIICDYNTTTNIISISFTKTSLGSIITNLMETVDSDFQLEFPWTFLNDIDLSGLSMTINLDKTSENYGITLTYTSSIDLGFLKINSFTIAKNKAGVTLDIDGSFLGLSTSDPSSEFSSPQPMNSLPSVPGQGNSMFELNLLALGQRAGIPNASSFAHVTDVIKALGDIKSPNGQMIPLQPGSVPEYNPDSNWLVATNFGILQIPSTNTYSIDASIVFNDPNIYGLQLSLNGDKMKFLAGLSFEVMYKKVSDTLGVYQVDFTLPASVRNLDFGEFNIVIPSFSLLVYTNGNFLVDIGFPYKMDFSQSFTVNAIIWVGPIPIPVIGSAGFYFGILSSATCPQVPKSTLGTFNPVVVFGIGAQIGFGYTFNKGILTAGFSLTAVLMFEGIIATWQPYPQHQNTNENSTDLSTSYYFWIKGTVGIVGKLWGSIDFAIIKASLDITISLAVSTTYESYMPMPFSFTASISVKLSVKINLGLFSINVHFSFSLTLSENLSIGSNTSTQAPWYDGESSAPPVLNTVSTNSMMFLAQPEMQALVMKANAVANPVTLNVYFIPHLTITGDETGSLTQQNADYVAMLYMDTIPAGEKPTGKTSFEQLSTGVFEWVLTSYLQSGVTTVTATDLTNLYNQLNSSSSVINEASIMAFLQATFVLNIQTLVQTGKAQSLDATVFPMIPSLGLNVPAQSGDPEVNVDFATFTQCDSKYISSVQEYFAKMMMNPSNSSGTEDEGSDEVSVASIVFADYFVMIARNLVQSASDALKNYTYAPQANDSFESIVNTINGMGTSEDPNKLTFTALATSNSGLVLGDDIPLVICGVQDTITINDTPLSLAVQYGLSVSQLVLQNEITSGLIQPGVNLSYNGASYSTIASDTFDSIAAGFSVSLNTLATSGSSIPTQVGLINTGVSIEAGSTSYTTKTGDTLSSIAQQFKVTVSALSVQNQKVPQLLVSGTSVFFDGQVYVIQPKDTIATVAAQLGTDVNTLTSKNNSVFSNPSLLAVKANFLVAGYKFQVQSSDTLSSIQLVFNALSPVSMESLLTQNRFLPNLILSGVDIAITGQTTYTTQVGDTINSIINAFPTVSQSDLASAIKDIKQLFRAQSAFYIPIMSYKTASSNTTDTLQKVASNFQVTVNQLASVPTNQMVQGIFSTETPLTIPDIQSLSVEALSRQVLLSSAISQASGMVSRYLMHGLRLPINEHIKFAGTSPCGTSDDCALYNLTGQQFILPSTFASPYTINLKNPTPSKSIQFNGSATAAELPLTLATSDQVMITSVLDFAKNTGVLPDVNQLIELSPYAESAANFTFKTSVPWQPGSSLVLPVGGAVDANIVPELWSFPSAITQAINSDKTLPPLLAPYLSKGGDLNNASLMVSYGWATLLNLSIRKVPGAPPFCYELVGADEMGTQLLQNLLTYMDGADNNVISDIDILYTDSSSATYLSDGNSNIVSFLLQSNLSTTTNPPQISLNSFLVLEETSEPLTGILNSNFDFLKLLWECSITRSGGFYIYYDVFESGTGFPDTLFQDSQTAEINILISYQNPLNGQKSNQLSNFMNTLVTGVTIDPSKDIMYAQSQPQETNYTIPAASGGKTNMISIADVVKLYNILPSDLVLENPNAGLNPDKVHISIPNVYYQMKNGDSLTTVATYFSAGGLKVITASQLQTQNPNVTPGPWAMLNIGDITLVTGTGGPTNTLSGVLSYYGITADAFAVENENLQGLFANNTKLNISDQLVTRASIVPPGSAGYWMSRTNPGDVPIDPTDPTYDNSYLQNAYNQISATVLGNTSFNSGTPGMPVGPTDNSPDLSQRTQVEEYSDDWQYSQAVQLSKYAINRGMVNVTGLPQDSSNPYAGVGSMAQINLDWLDLFGNHTVTPFSNPKIGDGKILNNIPVQFGYTDNLTPLASWPSVSSYFVVNQDTNDDPRIQLGLLFDTSIFTLSPTQGNAFNVQQIYNAQQALTTYESIYYQLCQVVDPVKDPTSTIKIIISSSLLALPYTFTPTQFKSILTFVGQIYTYLVPIAALSPTNPPPQGFVAPTTNPPGPSAPKEIDLYVPLSIASAPAQPIFEIEVQLSIQRQLAQVHDDFKDVLSVWNASAYIQLPTMANNSSITDLVGFANEFEKTMNTGDWQLKIATGMPDVTGATASTQSVWAIQWGIKAQQDLSVSIANNPVYYAMTPLANSLQSDPSVPIYTYATGSGIDWTKSKSIAFTNINMDTWAFNCLAAIESLLSPQYAASMFLLGQIEGGGTDYVQELLDYKQSIAAAIMNQVTNILAKETPTQDGLTDAQQQMYQQLLSNLTSGYTINAVIQFPVSATSPYPNSKETTSPNLFGSAVTLEVQSEDTSATIAPYSLSTSKVPINGSDPGYLTFMFNVNTPGNQTSFAFNISYQVSHLEHDIQSVPGITVQSPTGATPYLGSQWLNFVVQPTAAAIGDITVPVLLRDYPTAPSTLTQSFGQAPDITTIAEAREWDYSFTYASSHEAQDSIDAYAEFNLAPVKTLKSGGEVQRNLLHDLAEFDSVFEQIQKDLDAYLLKVTRETTTSDKNFVNAKVAVVAFNQLISNISTAWPAWQEAFGNFNPPSEKATTIFEFDITESPLTSKDESSPLVVSLASSDSIPSGLNWPLIGIDGYKSDPETPSNSYQYTKDGEPSHPLSFEVAQTISNRLVEFTSLDILAFQNAWASISLKRNAVLAGQATNPDFIYQTPFVSFANRTVPLLNCDSVIDVSALNSTGKPAKATMLQHLENLFKEIFKGDSALEELIKISCNYSYNSNLNFKLPHVQVPVLLATPFEITIPSDCSPPAGGCSEKDMTFVCTLASSLLNWFASKKPSLLDGQLEFSFSLFSKIDPSNQLPIFQLTTIQLNVCDVTDI